MTRIIIASTKEEREAIALKHITELLRKEFKSFLDLLKVPDIHYLKSTESSIGIDEVKRFIQKMMYKPFEEGYQIAILDNCDLLTTEAQNALLKTLEDSNENTIFFLLVKTEPNLLETILSRGSKYYGSIKESIDIQDSVDEFMKMNIVSKLSYVEKLGTDWERDEISNFLKSLLSSYNQKMIHILKEGGNIQEIVININTIQEAVNGIDSNANKKLALFNMVVQMG